MVAAESPHGVAVAVSDFELARSKLYRAKASAPAGLFEDLEFRLAPNGSGELWITKSSRKNGPPEALAGLPDPENLGL